MRISDWSSDVCSSDLPNLLLDRNFAIGVVVVFAFGMISYVPMVLLPTMLQEISGSPDSIIGGLLAARGAGALLGFFLALWAGKRSEDRRVGQEGLSTCRYRWSR